MVASPYPGSYPNGAPQPGTPGAGALPTTPSPTLAASLALVPLGLTAICVFPPFLNPRTVDAIGVIFRETSGREIFFPEFYCQFFQNQKFLGFAPII